MMSNLLSAKGPNALRTRKTIIALVILAVCFAVFLPKMSIPIGPMIRTEEPQDSGCCEVIFDSDINTADIVQELCHNILEHRNSQSDSRFMSNSELCRQEVLGKCGIDLSSFLMEAELGKSYKQILGEIRSFNESLCLKLRFGVPSVTPHLVRNHILMPHSSIKQERQTPKIAGSFHPALRERGRAIPRSDSISSIGVHQFINVSPKMRISTENASIITSVLGGLDGVDFMRPLYAVCISIFILCTISKTIVGIVIPLYTARHVLSFINLLLKVLRGKNRGDKIHSETRAQPTYQ